MVKTTTTKIVKYQKRYRRKRFSRGRPRLGLGNMPFNFKRTCSPLATNMDTLLGGLNGEALIVSPNFVECSTGGNGTSGVTYYSMAHTFTLDQLPDFTEYTTLFDQYRIMGVGIRIIALANTSSNSDLKCILHAAPDINDGAALTASATGVNLLRSRRGYKCRNLLTSKPFKAYTKVKLTQQVEGIGGTRYITPYGKPFSNSAYPDVKYYGYKTILEIVTTNSAVSQYVQLKYELVYYIQCKDPR